MISKKSKKNLLLLSSTFVIPGVILPTVISCSETTGTDDSSSSLNNSSNDKIIKSIETVINNNPIELSQSWKSRENNTANDFHKLIVSAGNNSSAIETQFNLYTTYSNLKSNISALNSNEDLGLTSINVSFGPSATLSKTLNSLNYQLIISFSTTTGSKKTMTYDKVLVGFKTYLDTFNNRVKEFEQWINQLKVSEKASLEKTSKDVYDEWFAEVNKQSNSLLSSQKVYNTLSVAPINQNEFDKLQNDGVFRDLSARIKTPADTSIAASKQCVSWNENETDKDKKGTVLTVTFVLSAEISIENGTTRKYSKDVIVNFGANNDSSEEVRTYVSFQKWFDNKVANFVDNKNDIKGINNTINSTTSVLNQYYEILSDTDEANKNVNLKNFLNNYFIGWNFEEYNNTNLYGLTIDFKSISLSTKYNTLINVAYSIHWDSEGLSKDVNFDLAQSYLTDEEYFTVFAVAPIKNQEIEPSNTGRDFSSNEIYDEYNKFKNDNLSLDSSSVEYQNKLKDTLSQYMNNLPFSNATIVYEVQNVAWNDTDNVQLDLGKKLLIDYNVKYYKLDDSLNRKKLNDQLVSKTITGFISGPDKLLRVFNEKAAQMEKDLVISDEGRKHIADEVDKNNWTTYIDNTPEENFNEQTGLGYQVSFLTFDKNESDNFKGGIDGELKVSFTWTYTTEFAGIKLNPFSYSVINKQIKGFKTYYEKAKDNLASIVNDWRDPNYLKNHLKSGVKLNTWFTSYFGYDLKNQNDINNAFASIWNLPFDRFGIKTDIINVKYSRTDHSLSDTQLKFTIRVINQYPGQNDTIAATQTQEYTVDGFMDPYDSTARSWVAKADLSDFNDGGIQKYGSVEQKYKFGDANSQTSYVSWWLLAPYSYYEEKNQNSWIDWAKPKIESIISDLSSSSAVYSAQNIEWYHTGTQRRGTKDSDGCCRTSTAFKIRIVTTKLDQHNNTAQGKYNDLTSRKLVIYLYFKNQYWRG